ncbi:MAG: DUF4870 domain-containing protein [Lentisphaeria bacterium]|nr:DUF4870 domain-containing protein [Lentisphaeria bacterium]NQZ66864.1 DUF4870 domain-containing protein [Lentisphaeria bacterium]
MSDKEIGDISDEEVSREEKQWAMLIHFSTLAMLPFPLLGIIVPIVLWQVKKYESDYVDRHGKIATNFVISYTIWLIISALLILVFIGFLTTPILTILVIVFAIIAGLRANEGKFWDYPLTIEFIK